MNEEEKTGETAEEQETADTVMPEDNSAPENAGESTDGDTPGKGFESFDGEGSADTAKEESSKKEKAPGQPFSHSVYEWVEVFGYALAVMMLLFLFVFKYVSVDGSSMSPTFNPNLIDNDYTNDEIEDRLIITNLFYTPKTGDVVVVTSENHDKPLIKRVIASSGQKVKLKFSTWQVWVDGELLDESEYLIEGKNYFPYDPMSNGSFEYDEVEFTVGEGRVFVMGDNRQHSLDSRFSSIGQLRIDDIMGKVIARVYPLSSMKWFG